MSKKNRERRTGENAAEPTDVGSGQNWLPIVLAFAALGLGGFAWINAIQLKQDTTKQLVEVDTKLMQLQTQVANAAKAKPAPPQGPDPNKVYTVKTDGSPFKGNAAAPIVIAEFSEYQ